MIFQEAPAHLFVFQLTNFKINIGEAPLGLMKVTKTVVLCALQALTPEAVH
jgi:hypothetical protein